MPDSKKVHMSYTVRIVPGKSDIAFAEYATGAHAEVARKVLNGFQISPTHAMGVDFAKR
jgi:hypothetical protein